MSFLHLSLCIVNSEMAALRAIASVFVAMSIVLFGNATHDSNCETSSAFSTRICWGNVEAFDFGDTGDSTAMTGRSATGASLVSEAGTTVSGGGDNDGDLACRCVDLVIIIAGIFVDDGETCVAGFNVLAKVL